MTAPTALRGPRQRWPGRASASTPEPCRAQWQGRFRHRREPQPCREFVPGHHRCAASSEVVAQCRCCLPTVGRINDRCRVVESVCHLAPSNLRGLTVTSSRWRPRLLSHDVRVASFGRYVCEIEIRQLRHYAWVEALAPTRSSPGRWRPPGVAVRGVIEFAERFNLAGSPACERIRPRHPEPAEPAATVRSVGLAKLPGEPAVDVRAERGEPNNPHPFVVCRVLGLDSCRGRPRVGQSGRPRLGRVDGSSPWSPTVGTPIPAATVSTVTTTIATSGAARPWSAPVLFLSA